MNNRTIKEIITITKTKSRYDNTSDSINKDNKDNNTQPKRLRLINNCPFLQIIQVFR